MGVIKDITNLDDYKEVLSAEANKNKLIVVDFYAQWCGPCRAIAPELIRLADAHDIIVLKIDVDQAQDVSVHEEIKSMPTFKFYKNGAKLEEFKGADKPKLVATIGKYLNQTGHSLYDTRCC